MDQWVPADGDKGADSWREEGHGWQQPADEGHGWQQPTDEGHGWQQPEDGDKGADSWREKGVRAENSGGWQQPAEVVGPARPPYAPSVACLAAAAEAKAAREAKAEAKVAREAKAAREATKRGDGPIDICQFMKRRKVFGSLHGKTLEEWTAEEEAKLYASPKMQAWQENCEVFLYKGRGQ